ncbi:MAG: phytoene/squalene synthase family protein [Saprospiraceae bacterium]
MKALFDQSSYICSKELTKVYSTSFSWCINLLPPTVRKHIFGIYGFVRLADEIVDSFHGYEQEKMLNNLEDELAFALKNGISINPIIHSFVQVVHQFGLDDFIYPFLKSMRQDLYKKDYITNDEYNEYIYGSADVVGLMCLKVFVKGNQENFNELKPFAMKLGSAFQKVNFLRDMKDDKLTLGRSYFPSIVDGTFDHQSKMTIINEIKHDFDVALQGIAKLPTEVRFGVFLAYRYYLALLKKIERSSLKSILTQRIRVPNNEKSLILLKSYLVYTFKRKSLC